MGAEGIFLVRYQHANDSDSFIFTLPTAIRDLGYSAANAVCGEFPLVFI